MGKGIAVFDYNLCMACCVCSQACPFDCITDSKIGLDSFRKAYPELRIDHHCTGCGICVNDCPIECIRIEQPV